MKVQKDILPDSDRTVWIVLDCLVCRRYFSENFDYVNYKPNYLKLGDDVWDASELGVKVRNYTGETKLVFLYFKQEWFKDTVKKFIRYPQILHLSG